MAKGAVFTPPVLTKQLAIQIGAGGTSLDQNWDYPLIFDKTEWVFDTVAWDVRATQTYQPTIPGGVNCDASIQFVSHNPDLVSPVKSYQIGWNALNATMQGRFIGVARAEIQGVAPEGISIRLTHNYRLPVVALTPQVCTITDMLSVVLVSLVDNPKSMPRWGNPVQATTNTPQNPFGIDPLMVTMGVAILGIAGLLALGYFADKTGVNVGVVQGAYGEARALAGTARGHVSRAGERIRSYTRR